MDESEKLKAAVERIEGLLENTVGHYDDGRRARVSYQEDGHKGRGRVIEVWNDEEPVLAVADKDWPESFAGELLEAFIEEWPRISLAVVVAEAALDLRGIRPADEMFAALPPEDVANLRRFWTAVDVLGRVAAP